MKGDETSSALALVSRYPQLLVTPRNEGLR